MKTFRLWALIVLAFTSVSSGCLLPEERENDGIKRVVRRQSSNGTPIGTGDRFSGGATAPRGLGTQSSVSFSTLLNVAEIKSGLQGLATAYGVETFTTPYKTYEGATVLGAKVGGSGGTCNNAYRVFFNGNIHARERGSMDGVLYFISDLLYANKNGGGLAYGSKTYTNAQVKTALSAGIVFIPLSNPDGVAYDQSTNSCWRKNRNPASGSVGVDLNRNFDFLWDFKTLFSSSVQSSVASTSPSSETFHGTGVFSEPETKNIKWVFDTYSKIRWFVDLHSYAGDVLYSWGSDENQSNYPYMNFLNSTYNGVRGILSDTPGSGRGYGEYTPKTELDVNVAAAQRMTSAMTAGGGRSYTSMQAAALYPTSGASDDYAYSRHFADSSKNLVHAYTVEFGFGNSAASCPFYPTVAQYNSNLKATSAGFMELLLSAVDLGLGDAQTC
ncbi:hypothetical protein B0J13DRAFT_483599 [Dactylonectria estremocensis]|uniref:Peptidase M14 domain-containing protein n=1 Tax=Dactylonectria estremocensis TaxID=1079267 RepID=A0A9P9DZF4_9HYPO|nr:hypothetical protein B0J13DRAFT_483599 [Dactylonectria estremocensis]